MKAILAGAFDPFTAGHRNLAERALSIFGEVVIAVAEETGKNTVPIADRVEIAEKSVADLKNVAVQPFSGLLSDFLANSGECVLVRGVRGAVDLEYERDRLCVYKSLSGVDAVLLSSEPALSHVSSTVVRELARISGPIDGYVVPNAKQKIQCVYGAKRGK